MADNSTFDPTNVDLTTADPTQVVCFLTASGNDYDGRLGARISAIFVILATSSFTTLFPVLATRVRWFRIPLYVYLFARYFGAGVIIATAFIHLLDPAYGEIGPQTCVGMTGHWADYSWPPALALASVMFTFLLDFGAEWYVERHYGLPHAHGDVEESVTDAVTESKTGALDVGAADARRGSGAQHQYMHSADQDQSSNITSNNNNNVYPADLSSSPARKDKILDLETQDAALDGSSLDKDAHAADVAFRQQFAAFLVLEFGVIFHSVIIGLNLGVVGEEFTTLYPVIVFHQAFEGLGIGARLSAIPFPPRPSLWLRALPWLLCAGYGLTTPIAISIGLGLSTQYEPGSFTAQVVSGLLDSISAGILIYTGLVELLARDFLFNPERTRDGRRIIFMLVCLFLGTGIMALLGKWA